MHNLQTKARVIKITISNLNSVLFAVINKQKPCVSVLQIDEKNKQLSAAKKEHKAAKADAKTLRDEKSKK